MLQDQDSHSELDALLDATVDAIVLIDDRGIIQRINKKVSDIFGYQEEELLGTNISTLMPTPFAEQHDHYLHQYNQTGEAKIIGIGREALGKKKSGDIFPIDLAVGEVTAGSQRSFIGIIRDITARKRQEEELREAEKEAQIHREKLAHVTRLSTMGEMAAGIAHEINQPLTAITTYAQACKRMVEKMIAEQLMNNENISLEQITTILEKISTQAVRAGDIVKKMRSLAKNKSSQREVQGINEIIKDVANLVEVDTRNHDMVLELHLADDIQPVNIDVIQIQQVIINLIRNAIDASEPSGRILLTTQQLDPDTIQVSVQDFGHGIEADELSDLFNPFYTTKEEGLGMGLSICHSLIRHHGGELKAESEAGKGATFFFTLPPAV